MTNDLGRSPSGRACVPSGLSQSPLSQAEPLVPNAEQADALGGMLSEMDCHAMTDTVRALVLIAAWEAMKAFPPATVEMDDD